MKDFGHGAVGTRETAFTSLLTPNKQYDPHLLLALSASIKATVDTVKDGADAEENLWLPAGYTYLGQFIDHDLTFDNTSSLNPDDKAESGKKDRVIINLRSPRFDLDSLYGDGPDAQPFMYDDDGASLLLKDGFENQCQSDFNQAHQDLLRSPNGRAIIGDKRNDENSIVSQIHLTFIKFHNAVVAKLKITQPDLQGTLLFQTAQKEVRWAYQLLVIEDFLPRIVQKPVLEDLEYKSIADRKHRYALYTDKKRTNLPLEFVGAAYRFGHSGVRFGYRLNTETALSIFPPTEPTTSGVDSLLGFDPLPESHVIDDWGRFFPLTLPMDLQSDLGKVPEEDEKGEAIPNPRIRLQFAYKIDTTLADPLAILPPNVLPTSNEKGGAIQEVKDKIAPAKLPDLKERPSLALLNLLRGNTYKIQGGQAIAKVLKDYGHQVEPLDSKYLVTRKTIKRDGQTFLKFDPIDSALFHDTPLWFYILAEAQAPIVAKLGTEEFLEKEFLRPDIAKTQLGGVGGRIVAEVFYGLMDSDDDSYFNAPAGWKPIWAHDPGACQKPIFANLLKFAGQRITHPPVV
jgi:Animal haem peroxidase